MPAPTGVHPHGAAQRQAAGRLQRRHHRRRGRRAVGRERAANQRWRFQDAGGGYYRWSASTAASASTSTAAPRTADGAASSSGPATAAPTSSGAAGRRRRLRPARRPAQRQVPRRAQRRHRPTAPHRAVHLRHRHQPAVASYPGVTAPARSPPVRRRRVGFAPRPCVFVCPGALGAATADRPGRSPGPDRDPRPGRDQAGGRGDAPGAVRAGACRCHRYPVSSGSTSGWCRCCSPRARAGYRWTATATGRPGTGRRDG